MSDLVRHEPSADLVAWAEAGSAANQLAKAVCTTSFVPKHFQGRPDEATAAILFGAEAGLSPMQALQGVYVISGKPAMYARTMMAVVLAAGHRVWTEKVTDTEVVVCGQRRDSEHVERAVWTIARATKAGYTSNAKYKTDPQGMLLARGQADVCRRIAPDALLGMAYAVEELEDDEPDTSPVARKKAPPKTKPETEAPPLLEAPARRAQAAPPRDEPPLDEPAPDEQIHDAEIVDEPGTDLVTDQQMRKLHALFNEARIPDRDDRLAFASDVIQAPLESSKALTKAQASLVIDNLQALVALQEGGT